MKICMKIPIKGVIISNDDKMVYEWFDMDSTCPREVSKRINEASGEELEVEINSPGGSVYAGSEIYTALMNYSGRVNVDIVGVAASAASVVAMAGGVVKISPTAQIMIHNVRSRAEGDYRDLQHEANVSKNYNKSIANAYEIKTGMSRDQLLDLMDEETWLTAQKAKEYGFVDEVMFESEELVASAYGDLMLPENVVNKIRNKIADNKKRGSEKAREMEARLNLLKLRGVDAKC